MREDIRYLDELTAQTKLLCTHRIENKEQLLTYQYGLEQEMESLAVARKSLYNRVRRCKDDGQIAAYKQQISGLSKKLSLLRKEMKLCTGILSRSAEMKRKLLQVQQEEIHQGKEEKAYEQRSRSSRSSRQHES